MEAFLPVFLPLALRTGAIPLKLEIFLGKIEPAAIAAKSRKESRRQSRTGPRQVSEQAAIGMRVKELGNLFFVPGNIR